MTLQSNTQQSNNGLDVLLSFKDEAYYACLSILTGFSDKKEMRQTIDDILKENQVTYGILDVIIDAICNAGMPVNDIIIAEGKRAVDGKNSMYKFYFDIEHHIAPKLNDDGSVNYKEMGYVEAAKSGQKLFSKTHATAGEEGINVLGEPIYPIPGKEYNVRVGKCCKLSEDGCRITALCNGAISYENNTLSVESILEIRENVGNGTGNVNFPGEVKVYGNVLSGMMIRCKELYVEGIVEAAALDVVGDINIKGGIQGNGEAKIECGGNLSCVYINNAFVHANGAINADMIINSHVRTERNLILSGKKGHLVGGKTIVKGRMRAAVVGSELGIITECVIGETSLILEMIGKLKDDIEDLEEGLRKTKLALNLLKEKLQVMPNHEKYKELKSEYTRNMFITQKQLSDKHKELLRYENEYTEVSITEFFANKVFIDTVIHISDETIHVNDDKVNYLLKSVRGELIAMG